MARNPAMRAQRCAPARKPDGVERTWRRPGCGRRALGARSSGGNATEDTGDRRRRRDPEAMRGRFARAVTTVDPVSWMAASFRLAPVPGRRSPRPGRFRSVALPARVYARGPEGPPLRRKRERPARGGASGSGCGQDQRRIEAKNSSFDLVVFILSSRNSIAAISSMPCSSLRRIQIFCSRSGSISRSSRRVPLRLTAIAG